MTDIAWTVGSKSAGTHPVILRVVAGSCEFESPAVMSDEFWHDRAMRHKDVKIDQYICIVQQ